MIEDVDQYILIGEVSMGTLNVTFQVTAVFERISSHREWIYSQMRYPEFCPSGPNAGVTREEYMAVEKAIYVWIGISVGLTVAVLLILFLSRKSKSKSSNLREKLP